MKRTVRRNSMCVCALLGVMIAGLAQGATLRYHGSGDYNNVYTNTLTIGWDGGSGPGGLPGSVDQIRVNWGNNIVTVTNVVPNVANFQLGVDESGQMVIESGGVLTTVANSGNAVGYNHADTGVTGL